MTLLDLLFCLDRQFKINEIIEMTHDEYKELIGYWIRRTAALFPDPLPDEVEEL